MNFKRNLIVITSALVGALALTGCDLNGNGGFKHFEFIEEMEDKHEAFVKEGYSAIGDYDTFKVVTSKGELVDMGTSYQVFRDYGGASHIPSTGSQKMIVVPVEFSDYKTEKLNLTHEQYINNINKAFFGVSSQNAYVSVGEYFNRSSYGRLKLDGMVCDKVYTFPLSLKDIKERKLKRDSLATDYYKKVVSWLKENYKDIDSYQVEGLKTGKNIPIFMVYTYPGQTSKGVNDEFFWAYSFSDVPLSWASSSFMNLNYGDPDAHTYIHEVGHLFGLQDYYPTTQLEEGKITPEPTARIDMMDCSIGDETSLSKMMLNWTRPYYVKGSCEFEIRSFTEYGDVFLLSKEWNKTVFDEYYLLEFYTPTRLNTYDVSVGNSEAKLPTFPGIKIYHVDARLGYITNQKIVTEYCINGAGIPTSNNIGFAHDNNTYENPNRFQENYLYSLVLNNSEKLPSECATNENLFRAGDSIRDLKLNAGGSLNFKITVLELGYRKARIKIEKYLESAI